MINTCQCKRGFFVLRDCGQPAVRPCANCTRPTCAEHLSPATDKHLCVECAARAAEALSTAPDEQDWLYAYRRRYYADEHYTPIYFGTGSGSGFDDFDTRAFDQPIGDMQTEGDFGGAGAGGSFYDS